MQKKLDLPIYTDTKCVLNCEKYFCVIDADFPQTNNHHYMAFTLDFANA